MHSNLVLLAFAAAAASGSAVAQQRLTSVYTEISGKACTKQVDDGLTGAYTLDCPGAHGYRLQVLQDDERSSINIVTPDKRVLPLDYWDVVTRGFSTLGNQAEWRLARPAQHSTPVALIVRVKTLDRSDSDNPKRVSILAIARLSNNTACVTRTIDASSPNANERARQFASDMQARCLPRLSDMQSSPKG